METIHLEQQPVASNINDEWNIRNKETWDC